MWCMVPRYCDLHGWTRTYQGCARAGFQAGCHLRRLRSFTLYWRVIIGEREREEAVRVWLSGGEREGETDLLGSILKEWMAVFEHNGETFSHQICLIVFPSCVLFILIQTCLVSALMGFLQGHYSSEESLKQIWERFFQSSGWGVYMVEWGI